MNADAPAQTIEFPYKPSIAVSFFAAFCLGVLAVICSKPAWSKWMREEHWPDFSDFMSLAYNEKKMLICGIILILLCVYAIGRIPAMMKAGDLNTLRISPEGVTVPKGYFKIRPVFIAASDIKTVSRGKRGYLTRSLFTPKSEYIRIRHKDGTQNILKAWLPGSAAFEEIWHRLEKYQNPQYF